MWYLQQKMLFSNCHVNLRFHNPYQLKIRKSLFDLLLWGLGYYDDTIPPPPVPLDFSYPNSEDKIDQSLPKVSWINHSTFLIEAFGLHFLTDPIWADTLSIVGPKRQFPPPYPMSHLPHIDYVIISHNHYDHLDKKTLTKLIKNNEKITFIIPQGVKKWFSKHFPQVQEIKELQWWEKVTFSHKGVDVKITSVPAQHFSGRMLVDNNKTLWMGTVVEIEHQKRTKRLYYAGDTGYNIYDFKKIGDHFKEIDLSLIPIGAYIPRKFMSPVHINPEEAVKIHKEVHSKLSVACHFGTFKLSSEPINQPPYDLFLCLQNEKIAHEDFRVLNPGQVIAW